MLRFLFLFDVTYYIKVDELLAIFVLSTRFHKFIKQNLFGFVPDLKQIIVDSDFELNKYYQLFLTSSL